MFAIFGAAKLEQVLLKPSRLLECIVRAMELLLLAPLDNKSELPPSLLPVQDSWSTEPWEVKIARYPLHAGLVPQAYSFLPDPNVKSREVIAMLLSHRRGSVYLYTKGVKEEILSKSPESVLCVEDSFLTKLLQSKILGKPDSILELVGSVHKRDGMVLYQAMYKETDGSSSLLFHLRVPYSNTGTSFLQVLHSGITTLPLSSREVSKISREGSASSLVFPLKVPAASSHASLAPNDTSSSLMQQDNPTSSEDQQNQPQQQQQQQQSTEVDILNNLPSYLANAKPIQFLPHSPKLLETSVSAIVSIPQTPYPYLASESQILRGRDRKSDEDMDRYTALYYLGLIFSPKSKEK